MNKLVSVIVPVYNVEKYLEKCVNSIIKQKYSNIEILLIDDGSKDSSSLLCDEFSKKDQRIKVYHKANGGLSDARNYGISKATGDYYVFVDSDDWIDEDYVSYLYELITKDNYDISVCEISKITDDGIIVSQNLNNGLEVSMNQKEAIKNMINVKYYATSACGKMYKKECFKNIKFPVGRLFEDIPTNFSIFLEIEKAIFGGKGLYYYLTREGSITTKGFSEKYMDSAEFVEEAMIKVIQRYPEFKKYSDTRIFLSYFDLLKCFDKYDMSNKYFVEIITKIKNIRLKVFFSPYSNIKTKIKVILTYFNPKIVKNVFNKVKKEYN